MATLERNVLIRRLRLLLATLALASPLAIATRLQPSPSGLGTHQQLGLPPCTIRVLWGIRCPSCGMTTSWAYAVRGQWGEALQANASGLLLAVACAAAVLVMASATFVGRWPSRSWMVAGLWSVSVIWLIALAEWAYRLLG